MNDWSLWLGESQTRISLTFPFRPLRFSVPTVFSKLALDEIEIAIKLCAEKNTVALVTGVLSSLLLELGERSSHPQDRSLIYLA